MASIFYRSATWGEVLPNFANTWGAGAMTWGGFFIPTATFTYLGVMFCDITPRGDAEYNDTPSIPITYVDNPSTDIQEN